MSKKIDFLNTNTTQIDPLIILSKHVVLTNGHLKINSIKTDESDTLKRETIDAKTTLCQVTKINISMQKNDSILLSHTGLKYYYKTDRKVFEQIKRAYLSKQWIKSDFETQIKEIAHNIRNAKGNQKTKQIRLYNQTQMNMLNFLNF
jgi:predicted  nucleic acid-binding Zn-ribbon protein